MEKSTFDKNRIKRHEVASEFLILISFQYLWYTDSPFWEKTNPLPMTSTFSQKGTMRTHFQWRSLNNVNGFLVFSHFKKQNSTCLQQDQKAHEA